MATRKHIEQAEALDRIRQWFEPGDTVYTILRHRSASGMSRDISVVMPYLDEVGRVRMRDLSWNVAKALGLRLSERYEGIRISGVGMDMGFEIVYRLGRALWPEGTPEPHGTRNGEPDRDGGYALKHQWL